jgi:hypothetical protein
VLAEHSVPVKRSRTRSSSRSPTGERGDTPFRVRAVVVLTVILTAPLSADRFHAVVIATVDLAEAHEGHGL